MRIIRNWNIKFHTLNVNTNNIILLLSLMFLTVVRLMIKTETSGKVTITIYAYVRKFRTLSVFSNYLRGVVIVHGAR